ncbi:MAG: MucR family transcriptional regulator [Acetobacteraceae bacterium]|nr:MucR family transcriptional regulator [Acetobacteraceae bacterium]MSP30761.1 MucR family transcriptional regulator [Acetobacteraceae bacterium]
MADNTAHTNILGLTAQIVSAHVAHNAVPSDALPGLIQDVYKTLVNISADIPPAQRPAPAVAVKKSIFPDYLVCLEDGKKLKMLKRHLKTAYSMSPEQYRDRWDLDAAYPMVAPNYAKQRSSLAKKIGLGTKPNPAGRR